MTKQTIVNIGVSRDNNNNVTFSIEDEHSGDRMIEIKMSLKEFGLLLTGLHGVKGEAVVHDAHIAEKRKTEWVFCEKVNPDREKQREEVLNHFEENFASDGWELQNDGVTSKQSGDKHRYVIKHYEPVENPLVCERYY